MQNSRLVRLGKQSLKNRSKFTLMQQINQQQFSDDIPLRNTSTLYLDQNGKQTQFSQLQASKLYSKTTKTPKYNLAPPEQSPHSDLYTLPTTHTAPHLQKLSSGSKLSSTNPKLIQSQYMTDRSVLDSIREENVSQRFSVRRAGGAGYREKQKNRNGNGSGNQNGNGNKLLNIHRPRGLMGRGAKFEEIDFIGGNLYDVEDIITDITSIMDYTKRKNIVVASSQPKMPSLKSSKWLNSHFGGGLTKLDQMLMNYRTVPQQIPQIIQQQYYRQSKQSPNPTPFTPKKHQSPPFNSFPQTKPTRPSSTPHTLNLVVIKWNQLPMIGTKFQPSIYLKLQSYPQQEQYRRVVLKAYSLGVRSYSVFLEAGAGVLVPDADRGNDKNKMERKLMSEEQYARVWDQEYMKYNQEGTKLTEDEKELLMEFDIQWYRTIIQFCYHLGLEDLLEKQYDLSVYVNVMASIQRYNDSKQDNKQPQILIKTQQILKNQIKYLLEYFTHHQPPQPTLGIIRINNDQNMKLEQIYSNFDSLINQEQQNQSSNASEIDFCVWPLKSDNSQLAVLLPLGGRDRVRVDRGEGVLSVGGRGGVGVDVMESGTYQRKLQEENYEEEQPEQQQKSAQLDDQPAQKQKPKQNNKTNSKNNKKLVIKCKQDNQWDVYMKMENGNNTGEELKIQVLEELLFGVVYKVVPVGL